MAEPTGVIRPQPRNAALGALADFLQRANTAAARVQFNPQIAPQFTLADLLPLEGAAGLMQDVAAYGPRAINKGGPTLQTFRIDPRVLDVAEAASYAAPLTRLAKPAGRMAAQQVERAMSEGRGPLGAALGPVRPLPLDVYHGTPHRFPAEEGAPFGRFKAEKIGTGEGAQAYGYGHYTAEAQQVGQSYQPRDIKMEELLMQKYTAAERTNQFPAMQVYEDFLLHKTPDEVLSNIKDSGYEGKELQQALNAHKYASQQYFQQKAGTLYKIDLPDEAIDKMLDWDKPLSEQPEILSKIKGIADKVPGLPDLLQPFELESTTGATVNNFITRVMSPEDASRLLGEAGIPGIKYLDQASRNKPLKDIRREFLNELPEDAGFDDVVSLLGTGMFSPKNEAIIKALAENDWLGFDYPAQALSTALSPSLNNYDFSPSLMRAVNSAQEGGTRNFVVFPGNEDLLRIIERNNEKLPEPSPGYAEGGAVIKEPSIFDLTDYAAFQTNRMFPKDRGQDDRRDAARHMLAAGMLTRKFSPEWAERLGRWHEYKESPIKAIGTLFGGSMPPDYEMDTHNNQVGIMLGRQAKDQADLERLVRKYAREAALNEKNEGQAMIRVLKHPPLPPQQRQLYAGGGAVRKGLKGLVEKYTKRAPQDEALETARKNAVTMLGLPEDNTAMDRARAMGFDVEAYHGTGRSFPEFKSGQKSAHAPEADPSDVFWFVDNPLAANSYAMSHYYGGNPNIMPVMLRSGAQFKKDMKYLGPEHLPTTTPDIFAQRKLKKADSVMLEKFVDAAIPGYPGGGTHIAVQDPARIRSRFAVFDPARINEADLLGFADPRLLGLTAAGTAAGLGLRSRFTRDEEPEKKEPQKKAQGGIVRSEFEYDPAAVEARAAALMEEIDAAA